MSGLWKIVCGGLSIFCAVMALREADSGDLSGTIVQGMFYVFFAGLATPLEER